MLTTSNNRTNSKWEILAKDIKYPIEDTKSKRKIAVLASARLIVACLRLIENLTK